MNFFTKILILSAVIALPILTAAAGIDPGESAKIELLKADLAASKLTQDGINAELKEAAILGRQAVLNFLLNDPSVTIKPNATGIQAALMTAVQTLSLSPNTARQAANTRDLNAIQAIKTAQEAVRKAEIDRIHRETQFATSSALSPVSVDNSQKQQLQQRLTNLEEIELTVDLLVKAFETSDEVFNDIRNSRTFNLTSNYERYITVLQSCKDKFSGEENKMLIIYLEQFKEKSDKMVSMIKTAHRMTPEMISNETGETKTLINSVKKEITKLKKDIGKAIRKTK